ncbi:MAG: hypothetical protein H0W44_09060 [Gammaproteobacteria bacterium]|nr:hypothetical protein [Gammaproteobacteria bacterium]
MPEIQLQDGYQYETVYGGANLIVDPNDNVLVNPNVSKAIDNKRYIVGLREVPAHKVVESAGFTDQAYGYFIYDKSTKVLNMGLTKKRI